MYNLIRFLQKHNFIILFVFLEVLALVMLSRSHTYHRAALNHRTNTIAGSVYHIHSDITNYFSLQQQNIRLQQQNADLLRKLALVQEIIPDPDSALRSQIFDFVPARVINNTVDLRNNYIIINKGFRDGVSKDMGIISPDGVAGIIIGVSEHYATAMSLLHKHATLSVRFLNNDQIANLHWRGGDYHYAEVVDIPSHVIPNEGDTIVTSGHSFVFPEGLMVGTVAELIESERGNLNTASVKFHTDFGKLRNVYVVKNAHRSELDALSTIKTNE